MICPKCQRIFADDLHLHHPVAIVPLLVVTLLERIGAEAFEKRKDSGTVLRRRPGEGQHLVSNENLVRFHEPASPSNARAIGPGKPSGRDRCRRSAAPALGGRQGRADVAGAPGTRPDGPIGPPAGMPILP
jgi:hypothetical protein